MPSTSPPLFVCGHGGDDGCTQGSVDGERSRLLLFEIVRRERERDREREDILSYLNNVAHKHQITGHIVYLVSPARRFGVRHVPGALAATTRLPRRRTHTRACVFVCVESQR